MSTTTTAPVRPRARAGTVLAAGAVTGGVAAGVNLVIWGISRAAGLDLLFVPFGSTQPETVPAAAIVVMSLVPLLLAAPILATLRARLRRPARAWTITVAVVTLLSVVPLTDAHLTGWDRVALGLTHLVAAGLAVTLLPRRLSGDRPA